MHRYTGNSPQKLRKCKVVFAVKDDRIYFGSQILSGAGSDDLNLDKMERILVAAVKSGVGRGKCIHYAAKVLQNLREQQQREVEFNNQQALLSKREEEEKHKQLENNCTEQEERDDGDMEEEDFAEEDMEKSQASNLSVATSVGSRTATIPSPATSSSSITFDASIVQTELFNDYEIAEENDGLWGNQSSRRAARRNGEQEKEHRLAKEYMVLQKMTGLTESNLEEDDEEIEQFQQSVRTISLSVATTVSHNSSSSTITTVDMSSLLLDESISQQKPLWCMYERKSTCRRYSIDKVREKEKDCSGEPFPCGNNRVQHEYLTLQEKCTSSRPEVTVENLSSLFHQYAKKDSGGMYLNVMQFSIVFRLVTGLKGNLFEEMKMFNKFDSSGKGFITEKDFVSGWANEILERNNNGNNNNNNDVMKRVVRN